MTLLHLQHLLRIIHQSIYLLLHTRFSYLFYIPILGKSVSFVDLRHYHNILSVLLLVSDQLALRIDGYVFRSFGLRQHLVLQDHRVLLELGFLTGHLGSSEAGQMGQDVDAVSRFCVSGCILKARRYRNVLGL